MLKKFLRHKEAGFFKKLTFWILTIIIGLFFIGIITVGGILAALSIGLPDVTDLENLSEAQSTEIFDREGNLLYTIHGEENRDHVAYEEISPFLINATVAIEDSEFWEHGGFDVWALGKVALYEIFGVGTPRGGSTITQQYIKNAFLSSERSYTRKAKELILAIRLERAYSKEEILGLYLNRIPYGNNAYGAEKGAEIYFNKNAKDLDLAESSVLAALPQAPSRYNPFGDNKFSHLIKEFSPEELAKRNIKTEFDLETSEYTRGLIGQNIEIGTGNMVYVAGRTDIVLGELYEQKKITLEEKTNAQKELQTLVFNDYREAIKHPHFVLYIKEQLEEKYGKDIVEQGGLKVYTTLDPNIQKKAEEAAEQYGETNETKYGANNMAALTINAKTGEILAMLGSRDYFNEEIDGNVNVVFRPRQPGSSFKPIAYAQAFYNGFGPGSVIYDIPTKMGSSRPENYDGKYQGQMSIRKALGQSRNIPAIKTYFIAGEQDAIIDLSAKMGITTLDKKHSYGYPLALGAGEVPLAEMVTAYSVFANNGKKPELTGILRIENSNGDIIEEWRKKDFAEVLDPQIAFLINDILSDQDVGIGPKIYIAGKVNAAKTGTSTKENKDKAGTSQVRPSDAWTIGYTPTIVTGVWVGNSDGKGLGFNANGYDAASPIFSAIMTEALKGTGAEPFPEPEGIKHVEISKASGDLPGPSTPKSMIVTEIFPSFSVPTETEKLFFTVKIDKVSGLLATEFTPEEAVQEVTYQNYEPIADLFNWKQDIINYYSKINSTDFVAGVRVGLPPTEYDNIHTAATESNAPSISITSPSSNSSIGTGGFSVAVSINASNDVEKVEYYINNKLEYFTSTPPYTGYLNISKFMAEGSRQLIVAKVIDSLGYSDQSAIEIKIENATTTPPETPQPPSDTSASTEDGGTSE